MSDRPNTLQLTNLCVHEIDFEAASAALKCPRGRVAVEMLEAETKYGLLFLPDKLGANLRPDVGVVVAAGHDVPLEQGDVVIVRGYDGTWREEVSIGNYTPVGQLRSYGVFVPTVGDPVVIKWWDSIVGVLLKGKHIKPTGNNMVVLRDPEITSDGGILLSSRSTYRSNLATVVRVGPDCVDVREGDRVLYCPKSCLDIDLGTEGSEDLAIISESGIELIICEEAVA